MPKKGKQQILFQFLPGSVFDYGGASYARITKVRGNMFGTLNKGLVLRKIREYASSWGELYRRNLSDSVLTDERNFVFVAPSEVESELFPLVFRCSNPACNKVHDHTGLGKAPTSRLCSRCKKGQIWQLRFVRIHKCGNIEPLAPWPCPSCLANDVALDTRDSERFAGFKWKCLRCSHTWDVFPGNCGRCSWPSSNPRDQQMQMEVFRASRVFFVHTAQLINIPEDRYNEFLKLPNWQDIVAARYLSIGPLANSDIVQYSSTIQHGGGLDKNVSDAVFGGLLDKLKSGEIDPAAFAGEVEKLKKESEGTLDLSALIEERSGLRLAIWQRAAYDLLDNVIPLELGSVEHVSDNLMNRIKEMGLNTVAIIDDFPVIVASFAFTRTDANPLDGNRIPACYLNPFPGDTQQEGRLPIYIDRIKADALMVKLDPKRVLKWLELNDIQRTLPPGTNTECVEKAFFVNLFYRQNGGEIEDINVAEKIFANEPAVRLVLGLLHTYSHLAIKHAALLCGLEKTSIAEFVMPKSLSFVLYCNNRFGATIGAFMALFEQSLKEWIEQIEKERQCVYDPVCYDHNASCHACTHMPETSCRLFNQNLSRNYLFGGYDQELQQEIIGFFDSRVQE